MAVAEKALFKTLATHSGEDLVLNEARILDAKPKEDLAIITKIKFGSYVACEMSLPVPFEYVTSVMSYEKCFFPLVTSVSSLIYAFDPEIPQQITKNATQGLIGKNFYCYKFGLETAPGAKQQYIRFDFTDAVYHRTIWQIDRSKDGTFSDYYSAIIVEPSKKIPGHTFFHYETGFSAGVSVGMITPSILHSVKMTLAQVYSWLVTPRQAVRSESLRRAMILTNAIESNKPCEYVSKVTMNCTTSQVLGILNNLPRTAYKILDSSYEEKNQTVQMTMPTLGEFTLKKKGNGKAIVYKSSGGIYSLSISFEVTEKSATQTDVVINTQGTPPLISQLRTLYKENMVGLNSRLFRRLISEVESKIESSADNTIDITPDLRWKDVLPEQLSECLGFTRSNRS